MAKSREWYPAYQHRQPNGIQQMVLSDEITIDTSKSEITLQSNLSYSLSNVICRESKIGFLHQHFCIAYIGNFRFKNLKIPFLKRPFPLFSVFSPNSAFFRFFQLVLFQMPFLSRSLDRRSRSGYWGPDLHMKST